MVVEGWLPDFAQQVALSYFRRGGYQRLLVTGGPVGEGGLLVDYKHYAAVGAATLKKMGLAAEEVVELPSPRGLKDRTYLSALAVGDWLRQERPELRRLDICSLGPHTRRSRLLFARALGGGFRVGSLAVPSKNFDPDHWWRSSSGFRNVVFEAIALFYARFLFRWETEGAEKQSRSMD